MDLELRPSYAQHQAGYVPIYGVSIRTIKRWVSFNAPLDDPPAMVEWWTQHQAAGTFKQKCPDSILQAAGGGAEADLVRPVPGYRLEGGEDDDPVSQADRIVRLEYRRLQDAYESGDEGRIAGCRKAHLDAGEKLRHLQASARLADVDEDLLQKRYFSALSDMLRPVARGYFDLLEFVSQLKGVHFSGEDREEVQRWVNRHFSRLKDEGYAAP